LGFCFLFFSVKSRTDFLSGEVISQHAGRGATIFHRQWRRSFPEHFRLISSRDGNAITIRPLTE
jgi:hypothetical protein